MQKKASRSVAIYKIFSTFVAHNGGLAQLARALAWHARGHEFDSRILHTRRQPIGCLFLCVENGVTYPPNPLSVKGAFRFAQLGGSGKTHHQMIHPPRARLSYSPRR